MLSGLTSIPLNGNVTLTNLNLQIFFLRSLVVLGQIQLQERSRCTVLSRFLLLMSLGSLQLPSLFLSFSEKLEAVFEKFPWTLHVSQRISFMFTYLI